MVVNSTISGNHANSAGGSFINRRGGGLFNAGFSADATATIAASTISGNEAVNGGGIYNRADRSFTADLTVSNSTISGNSADYGGGIASFAIEGSTRISLSDSTITANNGSHGTSGIENYHYVFYSSSSVSMTNTIIDGASGGAACHGSDGTFVSNGFNLDNDDTCHLTQSSDLPGTDPLLGPLADNGGPTLTHALLESSPAIDAILAGVNGCGAGVTTDQRGVSRPQAGQPGGTLKCDIGAYERAPESGTVGDFVWRDTNGDGVQDAGEPGIAGVTVTLRIGCAAGNALTTTTDSAGAYHFANLASGNYQLEFIRPAGFSFSPRYAGGDFLVDSNPDPETGLDACRFLAAGQTRDALDAGLVPDTAVAGLGIGNVTVGENAGVAVIPVTLGAAQTATVSVRYITRSGSAKPGRDFRNRRGSLTFAPGETGKTILVPIIDDGKAEPTEKFAVALFAPMNATIVDGRAIVTIKDDDATGPVSLNVQDLRVPENVGTAKVKVNLSGRSGRTVTVKYTTKPGTAKPGRDYRATHGTLVFRPGETSKTVPVTIVGDSKPEPDEDFSVRLFAPAHATIADNRGTVTIVDPR